MRLGLISYDFDPPIGGLGIHVKRLVKAMKKESPDLEVIVLSPSSQAGEGASNLARRRWNKKGGCPLFSLTLLWTLSAFVQKNSLDLLHAQSGSGGVFLVRKPSVPLIVTAHHTYIDEVHLVCMSPLKKITKWMMSRLEKRTYRLADCILCVSKDTARSLIEQYGISSEKITIIENSIDVDRFRNLSSSARNPKKLLYIGRLEKRKGVDVLLKAFRIVAEKDPDVSLTLAGANLIGDSIITFLKEHRLESRVHMTGRISDQQMIELLSSEGILIVPSLLEGFGLIAAEGMAAGIPVLVSDSPGLRSIVKDRETGYLFRSSDAEDLARVLQEMVHDGSINSVARRAREEALVRFDPAKQAGETIRVYQVEKSEGRSQKAE